jgi:AraC family transcriptional regulator, positive regulator of tynA and feaB
MSGSVLLETSLDSVAESDRIDVWRQACAEALLGDLVCPTGRASPTLGGTMRRRWVDDVLFVEWESTGFASRYWPDSPANDYIGFGVYSSSYRERLTMRDDRIINAWGTTYLWDNARVREFEQIGMGRSCIVYVPRAALRAGGSRMTACLDLVNQPDAPSARLLKVLVEALGDERDRIDPSQAVAIRNSLLELISQLAKEGVPASSAAVSPAMRQSIEAWIERRIHLGPISPAEAAAVHGISVRSLHRLFQDSDDSFRSIVRAARIARARRDVMESGDTFQAIALRWGFSDASHFCREFRRTYARTPRDLRAETRAFAE